MKKVTFRKISLPSGRGYSYFKCRPEGMIPTTIEEVKKYLARKYILKCENLYAKDFDSPYLSARMLSKILQTELTHYIHSTSFPHIYGKEDIEQFSERLKKRLMPPSFKGRLEVYVSSFAFNGTTTAIINVIDEDTKVIPFNEYIDL